MCRVDETSTIMIGSLAMLVCFSYSVPHGWRNFGIEMESSRSNVDCETQVIVELRKCFGFP